MSRKKLSLNSYTGQSTSSIAQGPFSPSGRKRMGKLLPPLVEQSRGNGESTLIKPLLSEVSAATMAQAKAEREATLRIAYTAILESIGLNLNCESLKDTPARAAKALLEMITPTEFVFKTFDEELASGMVIQNGIWISSLCEHHVLPFFGTATVAMIPGPTKRVLGLSKFARLVRYHAAGLKTQERITASVGEHLLHSPLEPGGVGVSLRCYHTCMSLRGVKDTGAVTTTQYLGGVCKDDPAARSEFLNAVAHPQFMA